LPDACLPRSPDLSGREELCRFLGGCPTEHWFRMETNMNGIIYLIGLIVVIMAILSFFGLR
jgi:hypothetical protein